ncbi:MAG TPA: CheR family methyltransferase [Thermoanaerobaculia bacterium]|nr:CheR family methyltransferase [Thermoanaerobaculia bacterium]
MPEDPAASEFTRLLDYLKASRGFDFSAYKVSSLMRRIQKRMREVGVKSYAEYIDYLEVHPHEFEPLFDTVLINVTSFFRDTASWHHLQEKILPRLLEERDPGRPLRVWSAGCASGEEALSLAMVLAEVMGEEDFRRRVKIYATDADEGALAAARQASYEARQVSGVPQALLDKYFERTAGRFVFRNDLRRSIIFGRHDLIQDAAISRLDLLACRNTLMYFNAETQEKILARFHFALNKHGYLFLGKAETLLTHANSFRPVDLKHRIFTRAPTANLRERLLAFSSPGAPAEPNGMSARPQRLREAAFDAGQVAQIVVDDRGYLVLANEKARQLFGLGERDLGRVVQDLELSYRPVELRSRLDEAYAKRFPVLLSDVEWRRADGQLRNFEIQVVPLLDGKAVLLGASVSFQDLTHSHQLQLALARTNQDLETAYEELQSANEELETTNEELQSTIEELETTNEELQSANEELETMNEELQSTNEMLRTTNEQLQQSSDELSLLNVYLESILSSLRSAVVVLDRNLQVKIWSPKAEELWGARASETRGQAFLDLDIGLPVGELRQPLRQCLDGNAPPNRTIVLDGVNRRGKLVQCQVQCMPLRSGEGTTGVVVLVDQAEQS